MTDDFIPDETEVTTLSSGDVRISFRRDNGTSREVVLRAKWLPILVSKLVAQIESGQVVPIDRASLNFGQSYSVQGWQVQKRPTGERRLTLFVDLPDQGRVVSIPLVLSPQDVRDIVGQLGP